MKTLYSLILLLIFAPSIPAQKGQLQTGHTNDILEVKFSPDDLQLISYSAGDGRLCLWEVKTGFLLWMTKTEVVQKRDEYYNLKEFYWSKDGNYIVTKSMNGTYQSWEAAKGKILSVSDKPPAIPLMPKQAKGFSVTKGDGNFYLLNLGTKEQITIKTFSRTENVYDVSYDGSMFAEGGSWGNAAIKITDTKTGKARLLDGHSKGQPVRYYQPSELALQLTKEKDQSLALLGEAKARRDRQAALDLEKFKGQVYITFEHYGDMREPGEQRMMESDRPDKSRVKKSAEDANAIWLRLHNDAPLPIRIPTQSMYLPDPKCFHEFSNSQKLLGLCDGREISVWHGLEDKKGKRLLYGFDFGSSAFLLPNTSVLFAVPREVLRNDNAIRFEVTFQKETEENKIADYGVATVLRFSQANLVKKM